MVLRADQADARSAAVQTFREIRDADSRPWLCSPLFTIDEARTPMLTPEVIPQVPRKSSPTALMLGAVLRCILGLCGLAVAIGAAVRLFRFVAGV